MKLRKIICTALACTMAFGSLCIPALANQAGSVIGKVLSTDIVTYIDGIRVPSFNINGRTAVIAENLNAFTVGFKVVYNDSNRTLIILRDNSATEGRDSFYFDKDTSSQPVGTPIMDVFYTDIKTYYYTYKAKDVLESDEMESFNIGGYTCIYSDDLAKLCGTYEWDEAARTVNIRTNNSSPDYATVESHEVYRALAAGESVITRDETFDRWGKPSSSHLTLNSDGTYSTVEIDEHINIETYDAEFNHKASFAIKKELPLFGALYFGKDYNYIAFGQENLLDDNSREVIKIVIYDKSFVKISEVSVNNCKTAIPFDASNCQIHENDRYLVLHTARSQYKDENGNRPQTQLTVIVDKQTWQVTNLLGKFQYNHTSHALREFVKFDSDRLITANYSDAAPIRGAFLQELGTDGSLIHTQSIFNVGGILAANCTGGMIGGLEVSSSGYLVPMSSIDHTVPSGYSNISIDGIERETRDIYLLWADKNTWELRHTCAARYADTGFTGSVPYLVDLGNDTFMMLWQRFSNSDLNSNTLCYAFFDANGNQIGEVRTVNGQLSESCQPILSGGKVVWYVNSDNGRTFYCVNADPNAVITPPVPETPQLPESTVAESEEDGKQENSDNESSDSLQEDEMSESGNEGKDTDNTVTENEQSGNDKINEEKPEGKPADSTATEISEADVPEEEPSAEKTSDTKSDNKKGSENIVDGI